MTCLARFQSQKIELEEDDGAQIFFRIVPQLFLSISSLLSFYESKKFKLKLLCALCQLEYTIEPTA